MSTNGTSYDLVSFASGESPLPLGSGYQRIWTPRGVELNTASFLDLQRIVHIGPARPEILAWESFPLRSVDDLKWVSGLGPQRIEEISSRVWPTLKEWRRIKNEQFVSAVIDRFVDNITAVLRGRGAANPASGPLSSLPVGSGEGVWLLVRVEGGELMEAHLDLEQTEQVQERIRRNVPSCLSAWLAAGGRISRR